MGRMLETAIPSVTLLLLMALSCCFRSSNAPATTSPDLQTACVGSRPPVMLGTALSFCGFSGMSCCDAGDDAALREQFQDMNVSDAQCAATVKATLCEIKCSPFLGDLTSRSLPRLPCESPPSPSSDSNRSSNNTSPRQDGGAILCLERVAAAGNYLGMAAQPGGSDQAFLFTQDGKIWPASVPTRGSGAAMGVGDSPLLDLTDRVYYDAAQGLGLMGVAFHPGFTTNGRFFVSYTCDSGGSPACGAGRCSAASGRNLSSRPCPYQLVVAEYSAKGGDVHALAGADPSEYRMVFTMGLPHTSYTQHGGQILFRRSAGDGHLYLFVGAGHGDDGDLSNDNTSFRGKIVRFNVDRSTANISQPEIFALGLSNPRGCSFDSETPWYLYCANEDHEQQKEKEQVYLISDETSGNHSASMPKAVASIIIAHSGAPSIIGGLVYRGSADPLLTGSYLYMYNSATWTAAEESMGRYTTTRVPTIRCSRSSPMSCLSDGDTGIGRSVLSFGEDNNRDAFLLATDGIYRVVAPGLCIDPPRPPLSGPGLVVWMMSLLALFAVLLFMLYQVCSTIFGCGGQVETHCNQCCGSVMCCVNMASGGGGTAGT
ncbi:hypothetical protein ACP70R_032307 [Stipagrostis hirtigluma subsp. patula]